MFSSYQKLSTSLNISSSNSHPQGIVYDSKFAAAKWPLTSFIFEQADNRSLATKTHEIKYLHHRSKDYNKSNSKSRRRYIRNPRYRYGNTEACIKYRLCCITF